MFRLDITQEMTQLNLKKEWKQLPAMKQYQYMQKPIDHNEERGNFNIECSPEDIFVRRRIVEFMRCNHGLSLDKVTKALKSTYKKNLASGKCTNFQEFTNEQDVKHFSLKLKRSK